jgi:hypothetical protein
MEEGWLSLTKGKDTGSTRQLRIKGVLVEMECDVQQ